MFDLSTVMKNVLRLTPLAFVGLSLSACSWFSKGSDTTPVITPIPQASPPPQSEQKMPQPSGPTSEELLHAAYNQGRANSQAELQTYDIERHFQRTIRTDCNGKVESDKEETVKSPHVQLTLKAPNFRRFMSVLVYDERTNESILADMPNRDIPILGELEAITGSGRRQIQVKADMADAWLTFQVAEGINNLFVEFHYDCTVNDIPGNDRHQRNDKNQHCAQSNDKTIVQYPILIRYQEKHLPGINSISKSPSECTPESQKGR